MKRRIWQIVSAVLHNAYLPGFFGLSLYQGFLKGYCTPTLNCFACPGAVTSCPIGALQHFAIGRQFPFFVVGFMGIVGAGVGRMTCGWLCPFGFLQDMMKKISGRVMRLPRWMGNLKYVSLGVLAVLLPLTLQDMWFSKLCPAGGIEGAIPWTLGGIGPQSAAGFDVVSLIGGIFWTKMFILGSFLVAMVFIKRPFCRTMCPVGAIFSLFNRMSFVRMRVDTTACNSCGVCRRMCPVDIQPHLEIDSPECIKCLECTRCPEDAIQAGLVLGGKQWIWRGKSRDSDSGEIPA
jgi:ferredoxin-type protein NapH